MAIMAIGFVKYSWMFIILGGISVWGVVRYHSYLKEKGYDCGVLEPYRLNCGVTSMEQTIEAFRKCGITLLKINERSCYAFEDDTTRILVLDVGDSCKSQIDALKRKANQYINKHEHISGTVSMNESHYAVRINLFLFHNENADIRSLEYRNADILLRRVEGIVNFFVDMNKGELIIPANFGGQAPGKYYSAVGLMTDIYRSAGSRS